MGTTARSLPRTRPVTADRSWRLRQRLLAAGRYALLIGFLVVFLVPFVWYASMALKTERQIAASPFSLPIPPAWDNLEQAWTLGRYSQYLPNTVVYAVAVIAGVCTFSCLSGYALARLTFPGRNLMFLLLLVGITVPFQSLMIPTYYLARDLNILGTRLGMIVPATAFGLSFGSFLMRAFFRGLPEEIADAARVDGGSEWRVFRDVMLPLARPGLATLATFSFLETWTAFLLPLVLVQRDELRPVSLGLLFFTGRYSSDRGLIAAGVMFTIMPIILVYIALQRKFIEGITAGALK